MSPINRLLPADIQRLTHDLKEAFACASEEKSIKWLENAYFFNEGNPNLNSLLDEIRKNISGTDGVYTKIINSIIAQALINDPSARDIYLETLWHHLKDSTLARLNSFRRQLKYYFSSTASLNHDSHYPEHLALLYLITHDNVSTQKHYMTELVEVMYASKDSLSVLNTLAAMKHLDPSTLDTLAGAYTSQAIYRDRRMHTEDPQQMVVLNAIYRTPEIIMSSAGLRLKYHIERLFEYHTIIEAGGEIPLDHEKLEDIATFIKTAMNENTLQILREELKEAFETLCLPHWRHAQIQESFEHITPVLNTILEKLTELDIEWRSLVTHALDLDDDGNNLGEQDYLQAAATALTRSHEAPFKRYLAESALKPLSTEQVLNHFKQRPDILAEIYKLTDNADLIVHMNHQARHASISHDLGM